VRPPPLGDRPERAGGLRTGPRILPLGERILA